MKNHVLDWLQTAKRNDEDVQTNLYSQVRLIFFFIEVTVYLFAYFPSFANGKLYGELTDKPKAFVYHVKQRYLVINTN
jgi:hypothetical protein